MKVFNHRISKVALCIVLLGASWANSQEAVTAAPSSSATFRRLPQNWQNSLIGVGTQLVTAVDGINTDVVEMWWAKKLAGVHSSSKDHALRYPQLQPGSVVGVINFPADSPEDFREDSRDQKLAPGFYTLRYVQLSHPDEELGSERDVLLVTALEADPDPSRVLSPTQISERLNPSRKRQPSLLRLVPANLAYDRLPALINDDSGQSVLQNKLPLIGAIHGSASEMPIAVVLITPRKESGGS